MIRVINMNHSFLRFLIIFILFLSGISWSQTYPSRPITMVVPHAVAGTNDIVGRLLAPTFGEILGGSVLVENRPGAAGNIGTQSIARANKDGYSLLLTINSTQAINPSLYKNPGFDPIADFVFLSYIGATPYVLVTQPNSPYKSLSDVVAAAKKKPGEIGYGSGGSGTLNHLLGAMLSTSAGINLLHIPYKGASPAINDVLGGQIPLAFASLPSVLGFIKAGKLHPISISSAKRSTSIPDVPAMAETYSDCIGEVWVGLFAPSGISLEVAKKIQDAMTKAMQRTELRDKLLAQGLDLTPIANEKLVDYLRLELGRWAKIVKVSGAMVD